MKPTFASTDALLRRILDHNPRATLHDIRKAHPALNSMSYDHLGLRVSRLLERGPALGK